MKHHSGSSTLDAGVAGIVVAADVTPRWEWRTFVPGALPLRDDLLTWAGAPEASRDETYLLSACSEHNVKVRNQCLEIKRLERRTSGLELWIPVLRAAFPVGMRVLDRVYEAWGVREPVPRQTRYTLAELELEIVAPAATLRAVLVTKRRTRIECGECHGELVELLVQGERWQSVAFEDPDPARVLDAVRHLALARFANTSYPAALKRIVGFAAAAP